MPWAISSTVRSGPAGCGRGLFPAGPTGRRPGCRTAFRSRGVRMEPGAMQLTRMPFGASSSAMERVRLTTPALAATKAHWRRAGTTPRTEATLTMRPPPCRTIAAETDRLTRKRPRRSTLTMRSHSSTGNWSMVTRWWRVLIPALLTRRSIRPNIATAQSIAASTSAGLEISSRQNWDRGIPAEAARAPSPSMSASTTVAPFSARTRAVAWPMPRAAPVTRAILP